MQEMSKHKEAKFFLKFRAALEKSKKVARSCLA